MSEAAAIPAGIDAEALAGDLRASVRGEVRFNDGDRALYATDGSNYRQVPIGVVIPFDADDVVAAVSACRRHAAPVLPRGAGTSLSGQCCNVAVVLDMQKYMREIVELDPVNKRARVQPGVICDQLRDAAEEHHLTFAPDPATHQQNSFGGMLGNNSCGVHSIMGGRTSDNVLELDVLTYDGTRMQVGPCSEPELEEIIAAGGRKGEIYRQLRDIRDRYADTIRARYPDIPRRVSGFNLYDLLPEANFQVARSLVGSEATCVIILEATVRLVDSPPARSLVVLGYPDVFRAGDHVPQILEHGPVGLEGIDDALARDLEKTGIHPENLPLLPAGGGWLLVEFGGADQDEADANAHRAMDALGQGDDAPTMAHFSDPAEQTRVWLLRESGLAATAHIPNQKLNWPGWEDSAVPPARVGDYLRDLRALFDEYGYECDLYGHFGQGCIHSRIDFDFESAAGIRQFRAFVEAATDLVLRYGGVPSGEHGDGQARGELLERTYGSELVQAFREFKRAWDPDWRMNPGKVIDPNPLDADLRLGTQYNPKAQDYHFAYPEDGGDFSRAVLRCVGVGKCRKPGGQTMCPSYQATLEEKHTTRGRAHMLFEMLHGGTATGGWRDRHVKEALDLCLACKGCKSDCPVNVDMATYKAEFMAHYYRGRLRPRSAYGFGYVDRWARWASQVPRLANAVADTPGLKHTARAVAGISQQRPLPRFAHQTFQAWHRERATHASGGSLVIVWPDTFNNHFYPEVGQAAVEVLEDAGYQVVVPQEPLCCGRPLYDTGMLGRARRLLRHTLGVLDRPIREGVPVIGLEPSCTAVFRDELINLLPHDKQAQRLHGQTYLLSEFLQHPDTGYRPRPVHGRALVHTHCNHKAVMNPASDASLLSAAGLEIQAPVTGCCGMAGAFGYERHKYSVSVAAGENALLPAVRAQDEDTMIITDGFSCREQILHLTGRRALHPAEALRRGLPAGG